MPDEESKWPGNGPDEQERQACQMKNPEKYESMIMENPEMDENRMRIDIMENPEMDENLMRIDIMKNPEMDENRMRVDLNGSWTVRAETAGFSPDNGRAGGSREVTIPCTYEHCLPELIGFQGTCWFEKRFFVPMDMKGKRVVVNFQAVNYHAAVWVNGKFAGSNDEGFLPFDIPVTVLLKYGEENILIVRTNNETAAGELPPVHFWRSQGGIIRNVALVAAEWVFIQDVKITAIPQGGEGHFKAVVVLQNELAGAARVEISANVTPNKAQEATLHSSETILHSSETILHSSETILHSSETALFIKKAVLMNPEGVTEVQLKGIISNATAWSPENPFLYTIVFHLLTEDGKEDNLAVRFGFRTICVQNGKVLLNGEPVFFNGFNRHEDAPDTKLPTDPARMRQDFESIKKTGANFVRMCHYPHDSAELDLCDELGLLVMDEIPLCALLVKVPDINTEEAGQALGLYLDHAKAQLRRLITRDCNHPSIVFWSVSNETNEREPGVTEINNALLQLAKKLDPSRLVMHVSMEPYWTSDLAAKLFVHDDVICINEYSPMSERLHSKNEHYGPADAAEYWARHAATLAEAFPGKPVFVTEFGYQTGHSLDGTEDEEMQAKMIAIDYRAMRPYLCGALVWCYADHAWPLLWPSRFPMFGRDISLYGVLTRDRREKAAFGVYQKLILEHGRKWI